HLAAARARHVVVDDDAVVDHQLRGNGAHAGRGGHAQRLVHVRREGLRHSAQRGDLLLIGRSGLLLGLRLRRLSGDRRLLGGLGGGARDRLSADHGYRGGDRAATLCGGGRGGGILRGSIRGVV